MMGLDNERHVFEEEFPQNATYLTKDGTFSQVKPVGVIDNALYWQSKHVEIGLLMTLSALYFIMVLLDETKILQLAWKAVLGVITGG